jgi:hypothetical protein
MTPIGTVIGSLLLLHAAYSLQQYRSLVLDWEESTTGISSILEESPSIHNNKNIIETTNVRSIPIDVFLELGLAFVLLLVTELTRTGSSLRPVVAVVSSSSSSKESTNHQMTMMKMQPQQRPMMAPAFVQRDFDIYATRGKGL